MTGTGLLLYWDIVGGLRTPFLDVCGPQPVGRQRITEDCASIYLGFSISPAEITRGLALPDRAPR